MKYIFVINPKAGDGAGEAAVRRAVLSMPEGPLCETYLTKCPGDAECFIKNWCENHPEEEVRFIACGGDGTLNEVCNGAAGFRNVSLTVYPCGSGNDFVKAYGGAERFLDIPALLSAPAKPIDLMKAGDRYCDNILNFGFDTTVAITINKDREKSGHGNKSSYTKGVATALIKSMDNTVTVEADGEILNPDGKALLCTLANGQFVGGSFKCAPRSVMDDGLIDVCLIKPISRLRFVKILGTYTEGKHLDDPKMQDIIVYRQAKKIRVTAPDGFAYSLDGEIIYENDFTVEIVPGAVLFAVPEI